MGGEDPKVEGPRRVAWRELPWLIFNWARVMRAWKREDWERVATLLEPVVRERQSTDGDRVLLAHAYVKQGRLDEAIWFFEQVGDQPLTLAEQIAFAMSYAQALLRTGRVAEAKQHVQRFDRSHWPKKEREWAEALLETGKAVGGTPSAGGGTQGRLQ